MLSNSRQESIDPKDFLMEEFIAYIVKNLVDCPDLVNVRCYENDKLLIVEVSVRKEDLGKVIGIKGLTVKALRTIATIVCARLGRRVRLELVE